MNSVQPPPNAASSPPWDAWEGDAPCDGIHWAQPLCMISSAGTKQETRERVRPCSRGTIPAYLGQPLLWATGSCCHAMRSLPSPLLRFGVCFFPSSFPSFRLTRLWQRLFCDACSPLYLSLDLNGRENSNKSPLPPKPHPKPPAHSRGQRRRAPKLNHHSRNRSVSEGKRRME